MDINILAGNSDFDVNLEMTSEIPHWINSSKLMNVWIVKAEPKPVFRMALILKILNDILNH